MRNPFRKMSPEEQSVNAFLKGMRETMGDDQETRDIYALVKSRRDAGRFTEAQELINDFVQAATAPLREKFYKEIEDSVKESEDKSRLDGLE